MSELAKLEGQLETYQIEYDRLRGIDVSTMSSDERQRHCDAVIRSSWVLQATESSVEKLRKQESLQLEPYKRPS